MDKTVFRPCKGENCGRTDGTHSDECVKEHNECTKLPYNEQLVHHRDDGSGWKCVACNYGGGMNRRIDIFCANCLLRRKYEPIEEL